jgi:hypothetical protein
MSGNPRPLPPVGKPPKLPQTVLWPLRASRSPVRPDFVARRAHDDDRPNHANSGREAVVCDEQGLAVFKLLRRGGRIKHEAHLIAFDLLELDGRDLTRAPIEERKAELACVSAWWMPRGPDRTPIDTKRLCQHVILRRVAGQIAPRLNGQVQRAVEAAGLQEPGRRRSTRDQVSVCPSGGPVRSAMKS